MVVPEKDWETLLDVTRQMAETRTLDPLLAYATQQALDLIGAEYGYLVLLNDDGSLDFRVQFSRDHTDPGDPQAQISESILWQVLKTGEPILSADAQVDERLQSAASVHALRIHSILCLPLIAHGHVLGALYIENRSGKGAFDRQDLRRMRYFASQAAVSIANAMLNEALEERVTARTARMQAALDRLTVLQQVDYELTGKMEVDYVVRIALNAAVQLSGATHGLIGIARDDTVRLAHATGAYARAIGSKMPLHDGITARVMRDHQAVLLQDVRTDPDYAAVVPDTVAQMTLPLMSGVRFVGVLSLETNDARQFDEDTFNFVKLLAARIAVALDNARAYEELERLVSELDAFADTVAHDLKNPLGLIIGYMDLIMISDQDASTDPQIRQHIARVQKNADKMVAIIDALLLLAGVRKTKEAQTGPLDMQPIVREVITRLEALIAETGGTITTPDTWPPALGYAPWVEQVWINYVSNALKYGGRPPVVELGATDSHNGVIRFWVRDNGPGLTPEQQQRVFIPFTRLSDRKVEGHGLGLSIVQRIVHKLGGSVAVESTVGEGSTFSFTLPAATWD